MVEEGLQLGERDHRAPGRPASASGSARNGGASVARRRARAARPSSAVASKLHGPARAARRARSSGRRTAGADGRSRCGPRTCRRASPASVAVIGVAQLGERDRLGHVLVREDVVTGAGDDEMVLRPRAPPRAASGAARRAGRGRRGGGRARRGRRRRPRPCVIALSSSPSRHTTRNGNQRSGVSELNVIPPRKKSGRRGAPCSRSTSRRRTSARVSSTADAGSPIGRAVRDVGDDLAQPVELPLLRRSRPRTAGRSRRAASCTTPPRAGGAPRRRRSPRGARARRRGARRR